MILFSFNVFLLLGSSVYCELIDYREAARILSEVAEERSFGTPLSRFVSFMREFDKVYGSEEELYRRLNNFRANVEKAELLQEVDTGSAEFGITRFSDFSEQDIATITGLNLPIDHAILGNSSKPKEEQEIDAIQFVLESRKHKFPKSFDWRTKNVISSIQDQGRCQCCWAFSVASMVESVNAIKTKRLVDLSVQQLVDCDRRNDGCNGGLMEYALQYIKEAGGLESAKDYPYDGIEHMSCAANAKDKKFRVKVKSYKRIRGGEIEMQKWLYYKGPLSIGLNAYGLLTYRSGVLDLDASQCNPRSQNHALLLVGFGEEKGRDGETLPYWIVKNTWGKSWGEEGYFKIRRGKNTCGVAEYVNGVVTK